MIPTLSSEEILAARMPYLWPANPDPSEHVRRSVYLQVKRSLAVPLLQVFDAPGHRQELLEARDVDRSAAGAGLDE